MLIKMSVNITRAHMVMLRQEFSWQSSKYMDPSFANTFGQCPSWYKV